MGWLQSAPSAPVQHWCSAAYGEGQVALELWLGVGTQVAAGVVGCGKIVGCAPAEARGRGVGGYIGVVQCWSTAVHVLFHAASSGG